MSKRDRPQKRENRLTSADLEEIRCIVEAHAVRPRRSVPLPGAAESVRFITGAVVGGAGAVAGGMLVAVAADRLSRSRSA